MFTLILEITTELFLLIEVMQHSDRLVQKEKEELLKESDPVSNNMTRTDH